MTSLPGPRYVQAAAIVRAQIADGTLKPGQPAPSGAHLARLTGFSSLTCRKGLWTLIKEGVLVPGTSPNARPRVAARGGLPDGDPGRALSRALAARRRARGLTQPELAALSGYSVTAIGHAETGRLWQSREFWEKADLILAAGGDLAALHDAYLAGPGGASGHAGQPSGGEIPAGPPALVLVTLHWSDGTATSVDPPVSGPLHDLPG